VSEVTETAVTETPVVVDAPVVEAPKNAAEQRRSIRDRSTGIAAEINNAVPKARDDKGRYAASNEPAPEAAATNVVAETVATEVVQTPSQTRIEIPEGNPFRDRGKQFLDELSAEELRGVLNGATRSRDLQAAQQRTRELENRLALLEAEKGAWRENVMGVLNNPDIAAKYAELKAWDEGEANRWLRGVQAEYEQTVADKRTQTEHQLAEQEVVESGRRFIQETYSTVRQKLPAEITSLPVFTELYQSAMDEFDNLCAYEAQSGRAQQMTQEQAMTRFYQKHLLPALTLNSQVVQTWSDLNTKVSQAEQARLTAEATRRAEENTKRAAEAAAANRNPLSRIPSTVTTGSSVPLQAGVRSAAQQKQALNDRRYGR
jgi:hypothetical protein